jgi:hypothetical protein
MVYFNGNMVTESYKPLSEGWKMYHKTQHSFSSSTQVKECSTSKWHIEPSQSILNNANGGSISVFIGCDIC